jgi:signal transduction histidine kinase
MKGKLKDWLFKDFNVPKSEEVQFVAILVLTILIALLTIGEVLVDLKATSLSLIGPLLAVNIALLLYARKKHSTKVVGNLQLLVLYLMFELSFFILPGVFHVYIYWMVAIPLLAFIFGNLRTSHVWLVIVIITISANTIYGVQNIGWFYQTTIPFVPYGFAGMIFSVTLVACFSLLYNLLGRSYSKLRVKNREVVELIFQLKKMNGSLEKMVEERTKDIEERNKKLEKYAFMNAHLVRAPLANILGAIHHLNETKDEATRKELLDIIKVSATSLDNVIKEVGKTLDHGVVNS